jgi:hypothetical protein
VGVPPTSQCIAKEPRRKCICFLISLNHDNNVVAPYFPLPIIRRFCQISSVSIIRRLELNSPSTAQKDRASPDALAREPRKPAPPQGGCVPGHLPMTNPCPAKASARPTSSFPISAFLHIPPFLSAFRFLLFFSLRSCRPLSGCYHAPDTAHMNCNFTRSTPNKENKS